MKGIVRQGLILLSLFLLSISANSSQISDNWYEGEHGGNRSDFGTSLTIDNVSDTPVLGAEGGDFIISPSLSNHDFGGVSAKEAIMGTMIDLQSNDTPDSLAQFQTMSRSELIETRMLLEESLSNNTGMDRQSTEVILNQFDTLVANPILSQRTKVTFGSGGTFLEPVGEESITSLPLLEREYLSALNSGNNQKALNLRQSIINTKALEFSAAGIDPITSIDMAQSYLSLSTDSVAVAAGIDQEQLNVIITTALELQGLGASQVTGAAAKLLSMSASPADVARAIPYGEIADEDLLISTSVESKVPKSNAWLVNSRVGASEDRLQASIGDGDESGSFLNNIGAGRAAGASSLIDDIGNPFSEGAKPEAAEVAPVMAQAGGFDPFAWTENIRLGNQDLILTMMKRWFGGPISALQSYVTNANGTFRETIGQGGSLRASNATASFSALTLVVFFVLVASVFLASFYFIYGLYKGGMEGTFFGQQNDTGMVLGRGVISLAGNLPIPGLLGLTAIQASIFFGIFLSLGVAGGMATELTRNMISKPVIDPVPVTNEGFFSSLVKGQSCMALLAESGKLNDSELGNTYFKATFDAKGTVLNDTESYSRGDDGVFAVILSFFSSQYDPLDPRSDGGDRSSYVKEVYDDIGSGLDDVVSRYRFGSNGRCGEFFVPTDFVELSSIEKDKIIDGVGQFYAPLPDNLGNSGYNNLREVDPDDYEELQTVAQELHAEWSKKIRTIKNRKTGELLDKLLVDIASKAESITKYHIGSEEGDAHHAMVRLLRNDERNFYLGLSEAIYKEMGEQGNPADDLILDTVSELGMGVVGGLYWFIDMRQKQIMEFYDFTIQSSTPIMIKGGDDFTANTGFLEDKKRIDGYIDSKFGSRGLRKAKQMISSAAAGNSVSDDSIDTLHGYLFEGDMFADINNFNGSPIERVRHFGNVVQSSLIGTGILLTAVEAKFKMAEVSSPVGNGAFAALGSVLGRVYQVFQSMAGPLFMGAFICSNIIPALPYIMFTAAIVGLLVHYASFLVGAPVWWMQKMHIGGNDMLGHSGAGYTLFLLLIMRAPLIVLGFFLGVGLNWVASGFINLTFLPAMSLASVDGFNPTGYVGDVLIFSGLHLFACYKSFHLTWELPNFVASLVGSPVGSDLGEGEVKAMALGMASTGGNTVGGALTSFSGGNNDDEGGRGDQGGRGNGGEQNGKDGQDGMSNPNSESKAGGIDKDAGDFNKSPPGADSTSTPTLSSNDSTMPAPRKP